MKNIIILFLLLIGLQSTAQYEDWSAVKIGTDDMTKIYVGSTLVWSKGCQYGDLEDYYSQTFWTDWNNEGVSVSITSQAIAEGLLDDYRAGDEVVPYSGYFGAIKGIIEGYYLLKIISSDIECTLMDSGYNGWSIANGSYTLGNAKIVYLDDGIMTSVITY